MKEAYQNNLSLDQFFTNPVVAISCIRSVTDYLEEQDVLVDLWLEPSCGNKAFLDNLPDPKLGIELDDNLKNKDVLISDFLKYRILEVVYNSVIVIGNPPFGKKSKLAIEFFNHSAGHINVKHIAFIVPIQFRKWSVQSKLNKDFSLVIDRDLPEDSFIVNDKPYKVRCCFQLWTREATSRTNLRLLEKPKKDHKDFKMWQYNNTEKALKVFEEDFDFAVPRQGYQDYSRRETDKSNCEKNKQWILFKAKNSKVLERLLNLDFEALSKKNTTIPGFGKADVVELYSKLYRR